MTPTIETCKKLDQSMKTEFVYCHGDLIPVRNIIISTRDSDIHPAPLVSELMELLPKFTKLEKAINLYIASSPTKVGDLHITTDHNPAEALALCLLYLSENGLIK